MKTVPIALIEDEALFRDLVKHACARSEEITVWSDFSSGEDALSALSSEISSGRSPIDVAVVDIQLKGKLNGVQTAYRMRELNPDLGILLLSNHRWPAYLSMLNAFNNRSFSYLLKSTVKNFKSLERAIAGTAAGGVVVDKALLDEGSRPEGRLSKLTQRQRDILHLVAQGYSNSGIAESLYISNRTVENHLAHIYRVLEVDNDPGLQPRVQAVVLYLTELFPIHLSDGTSSPGNSPLL